MWKVERVGDISIDTLRILELMVPQTELLFIGTGCKQKMLPPDVIKAIKATGTQVEVMSTV